MHFNKFPEFSEKSTNHKLLSMNKGFIQQKGAYRKLRCYQLAEHIYDATFVFCERFIGYGDRTKDQMVQAARSGNKYIYLGSASCS